MVWYNPLEWPGAATRVFYTQAGAELWVARKAASAVGLQSAARNIQDYEEFCFTAADPTYVASKFREAAGKTQEERDAQKAEANRYTKRVVTEIAPNVERTTEFTVDMLAMVATGGLSKAGQAADKTLKVVDKAGKLKKFIGFSIPFVSTSSITNYLLARQGEAPMMTVYDNLPLIGDEHYAKGGTPDNHPARLAYLESKTEEYKVVAAMIRLSADGKELKFEDLNRSKKDGDDSTRLTRADKAEIEKIIGSEIAPVFFRKLAETGITFENQTPEQIDTEIESRLASRAAQERSTAMTQKTAATQGPVKNFFTSIFSALGDFIAGTFRAIQSGIASLIGKKPVATAIAAVPATNHPRSDAPEAASPSPGNVPQPLAAKQTGRT